MPRQKNDSSGVLFVSINFVLVQNNNRLFNFQKQTKQQKKTFHQFLPKIADISAKVGSAFACISKTLTNNQK